MRLDRVRAPRVARLGGFRRPRGLARLVGLGGLLALALAGPVTASAGPRRDRDRPAFTPPPLAPGGASVLPAPGGPADETYEPPEPAAPRPEPGTAVGRLESLRCTCVTASVQFAAGGVRPTRDGEKVLDLLATVLRDHPRIELAEIEGHVDGSPREARDPKLALRRAEAVARALVRRGVDPRRLVARGYGALRPCVGGRGARGYRFNRRVELRVLRAEGRPVRSADSTCTRGRP